VRGNVRCFLRTLSASVTPAHSVWLKTFGANAFSLDQVPDANVRAASVGEAMHYTAGPGGDASMGAGTDRRVAKRQTG